MQADPAARLLALDGLDPVPSAAGGLSWIPIAAEAGELVLLGLIDGSPRFAALGGAGDSAGAIRPARSPALFRLLDMLPDGEAATYAIARSLVDWHARHGFCPRCGAPTETFRAGWARRCTVDRSEHFPRTDPVVIMLAEHDDRALLGRQAAWPAGRYSALAGFLEPGESIEEAVAREICEEAGVRVGAVGYVASQPWPFPSQLMIACVAQAESDALTLDRTEIEDAIWVSRKEVYAVLAGKDGPFVAPPPYAIAHTLLTRWAAQ